LKELLLPPCSKITYLFFPWSALECPGVVRKKMGILWAGRE
jgi:hypothetical protein